MNEAAVEAGKLFRLLWCRPEIMGQDGGPKD